MASRGGAAVAVPGALVMFEVSHSAMKLSGVRHWRSR
jgi:hypothetical protein